MTPGRRLDLAVLLLVVGVALALRAERLGLEELTTDEAFSWSLSRHDPADIVARTAADVHPPLYYLVLHAWTEWCGDSPAALRGLSVLCGLAVVLLGWLLGRELDERRDGAGTPRLAWTGAAVAAVLVAVHADQVGHSRHVRMYGVGAVLAASSAWLLLRALRSERRLLMVWGAYSIAAAALCYTHYYGAFTVAAQVLFAGIVLAQRWRRSPLGRAQALGGGGAVAAVIALYAPWIPVLLRQTARVSEQYWIGDQDAADIAAALVRWITGMEWAPPLPILMMGSLAVAAGWGLWNGDGGQRFLLLQAVVPWLGALALSAAAGRWLLLERYLFFSQLALLVALARSWTAMHSPWAKRALAAAMGSLLAVGLAQEVGSRPTGEGATAQGARFLARYVGPRDLVLANAPRDLMVVRYHLAREGAREVRIQCPASRSVGHLSQVAALDGGDVVPDDRIWAGPWPTVWFVRVHPTRRWRPEPRPSGWTAVFTRVFEGAGSTRLLVIAYRRESALVP